MKTIPIDFINDNTKKRFWNKVQKTDKCWIWTAAKCKRMYGLFSLEHRIQIKAHRMSWVIHYGPIPDGLFVCHHCDNPSCVRPDHLFVGNQTDNMHDAAIKERTCKGDKNWTKQNPEKHKLTIAKGSNQGHAKLTEKDIPKIRKKYKKRLYGYSKIAKEYGVTRNAIFQIIHNITWTHV